MEITIQKNDNKLIVKPQGRLDSATSYDFSESLQTNFTKDMEALIIDFTGVDFISSKGLRVIVSGYKELNGRKMEIINANPSVVEVFRLSGLLKVVSVNQ